MIYSFTPGLVDVFPAIDELCADVKRVACRLDRDIRTRELRVDARRNNFPGTYKGWAHPVTRYSEGARTTYHSDGLIRMFIGRECGDEDIIRLYAHELRHIGQFHRGRKEYGTMTIAPLSTLDSEADAEAFEDRVLDRM